MPEGEEKKDEDEEEEKGEEKGGLTCGRLMVCAMLVSSSDRTRENTSGNIVAASARNWYRQRFSEMRLQ